MAISYPLSFPTINGKTIIQKMTMRMVNSVAITESPYTFAQQTQDFGGARWEAEITIRPLTHSEAKVFKAFLVSLKGRQGTFTVGNPLETASTPSDCNVTSGTKTKGSTSLPIVNAGSTPLSAGETFSINNFLYMALETVAGNTTSTIEITPPLRAAVTGLADIVTDSPVGRWRLSSNEVEWDIARSSIYSFTLACVEAIV